MAETPPKVASRSSVHSEAEDTLRRLEQTLQTLEECNRALVRAASETELLCSICEILVNTGDMRMAWVGYKGDDGTIRPVAFAGFNDGYLDHITIVSSATRAEGGGPTGVAARTGKPCWTRNIAADPNVHPWRADALKRGYRSSVALPLISEDEPFGVLTLYAKVEDAFTEMTVEHYARLADNLAYGVTTHRSRVERRRAEEERRRNEFYLEQGQRLSHTGSYAANVATGEIFFSTEAFRIFDWAPQTVKPTIELFFSRVHPDDVLMVQGFYQDILRELDEFTHEFRILLSTGTIRYLRSVGRRVCNSAGEAIELYGVVIDLTESKQAEEALRASEQKYRDLIELSPDAICVFDSHATILMVNPAACRMMQVTEEELVGTSVLDTYLPGDRPGFMQRLQGMRGINRYERVLVRKDGSTVPIEVSFAQMENGRFQVVGRDISDRKHAEREGRRLSAILAQGERLSRTGSWAWNVASGYTTWSEEHYRIFGFDSQSGNPSYTKFIERIHPNDRGRITASIDEAVLNKGDFEFEYKIVLPDGTVKFIHSVGHSFTNDAGELEFIGTAIDLTERKKAEEELCRSEAYLAEGQRLSHTGSWAWDVTREENVFWSEEHFRIFGQDPSSADPCFKTAFNQILPEDRRHFRESVEAAVRNKTGFVVDFRILLPDGSMKYVHSVGHPTLDAAGNVAELVGTAMDVTERKQTERLLFAERRTLEMIASGDPLPEVLNNLCNAVDDQSPGLISTVLLMDPDGKRLWPVAGPKVPEGYTKIITPLEIGPTVGSCGTAAYRKESVIVSDIANDPLWAPYLDLVLPYGLRACWSRPLLSTEGEVLGTFAMYYREVRSPQERDQRLIERASHVAQIAIERQRAHEALENAYRALQLEMSERRRAEEAFRRAQADLAHGNRVMTMGELTASIAHEVNQPLAAVVTNGNACLRWLSASPPDLDEARQAVIRLVRDGTRAADIVSRIRSLFRKAKSEKDDVNLNDIVREMGVLLRGEAHRHGVSIVTDLAADLPTVQADRVQLQQVMMNLIMNGIDAMKPVTDWPRELLIQSRVFESDHVFCGVQDSGVGASPEQLDRIFQPFFTTKSEGIGMGLSISRSIIEAHGGKMWATVNTGPGLTFRFILPTQAAAADD